MDNNDYSEKAQRQHYRTFDAYSPPLRTASIEQRISNVEGMYSVYFIKMNPRMTEEINESMP